MRHLGFFIATVVCTVCVCHSAPADLKDPNKDSKSAFGPAFDEIVVESSLTVRRKNNARQARNQNATTEAATPIIKTKREIAKRHASADPANHGNFPPFKPFGGSAANSQAQAANSFGPLGSFGSSATGAQTQSFMVGPDGVSAAGGFSGTQQYMFNGQTVDIAFGNTFSGADSNSANAGGAAITITGPDGKKRPFSG